MLQASFLGRKLRLIAVVLTAVILGWVSPALAVFSGNVDDCWKDASNQAYGNDPTSIMYCCKGDGLKDPANPDSVLAPIEHRQICVNACNQVDLNFFQTEDWGSRYIDLCCHLTGLIWDSEPQDRLEAKCEEAKQHTGKSSSCLLSNSDRRPDGLENCCKAKSEKRPALGVECDVITYDGSDTCKADNLFSCCACKTQAGRQALASRDPMNCKQCQALCQDKTLNGLGEDAEIDEANVPYLLSACLQTKDSFSGSAKDKFKAGTRKSTQVDAFCFTAEECTKSGGTFRAGESCPNRGRDAQGKCTAPEPDYDLQFSLGGVKTVHGLKNLVAVLYNLAIGLALAAAAVMFIWGAFKYMVSAAGAEIATAKTTMIDALVGMALTLGAYTILSNVAPATLQLMSFKIDMINRIAFYNVVWCEDVRPAPGEGAITFQDAGTATVPKDFDIKNGYPVTKVECGQEYFISGGTSDSVCTGRSCKAGICINCASALSAGCKTDSPHEFKCTETKMGGNIVTSEGVTPETAYVEAFCRWKDGSDVSAIADEIDSFNLTSKTAATASASGKVSGYAFKNLKGKKAQIQATIEKCKQHNADALISIVVVFSSDATTFQKSVAVLQPHFGVSWILSDKLLDYRWILNKQACGKNIAEGAAYYYLGSGSFEGWLEEGNVYSPTSYWSADEVLKMIDDPQATQECSFQWIVSK